MTTRPTPTESELAALADGSLEPERRERLLEQAQLSPELREALAEQQRALQMTGALQERAPAAVHARVQALVPASRPRRGFPSAPRLGLAAAAATALTAAALVVSSIGGGGATGLQQAAALTLSPPTMSAPAESPMRHNQLAVSVDGVAFPYWRERFGWRSAGARVDRIDGRSVTTVFYSNAHGRRIGYAIVSGPAWATHGGTVTWWAGVPYRLLTHDGATVVAWPRGGRLCVVSGRDVSAATLLHLASWSGERPSAV